MPEWLSPVLPLVGVALGYLGATSQDAKRWRRDWLTTVVKTRREHYLSLVEAMYVQVLLVQRVMSAEPLEPQRVQSVTTAWRTQYARNLLSAPPNVQDAVWQFDVARGVAAEATNANQSETYAERLADLDRSRLAVVDAINQDLGDVNRAVAQYLLSPWQRWRVQRQNLTPWLPEPE